MSDPLNHLGSIWYHSEPLEVPYFPNQFLGLDFFCRFLQQTGSSSKGSEQGLRARGPSPSGILYGPHGTVCKF